MVTITSVAVISVLFAVVTPGCILACGYGYHDSYQEPGVFHRLPRAGTYGETSLYQSTNPKDPLGMAASRGNDLVMTFFSNDTVSVSFDATRKSDNVAFAAIEAVYSDLGLGNPPAGARGGNWYNLC